MARLLNIHVDILTLAKAAPGGAPAPAPEPLRAAVDQLLRRVLLEEQNGTIRITEDGEVALEGAETPTDA